MPRYEYHCEANNQTVEVVHSIREKKVTWGEICDLAGIDPGNTPPDAPVTRLISRVNVNTPVSNSKYKEMGFTKLVRREKGVYENVTATGSEKRFVTAQDANSLPDLKRKIRD